MTDIDPWCLERPDVLLRALERSGAFGRPAVYLVRVDHVVGRQDVTGWTRLWEDPPAREHPDRTKRAEAALARLQIRFAAAPADRPLVVSVVVRPGRRVWTFDESEVALALRYAANRYAFVQSDLLVVTERGWWSLDLDLRQPTPCARWAA